MDFNNSLVKCELSTTLNSSWRLNRLRIKKLTVVDPTLFYLQAGLSAAFPPYVPRQQDSKESSLDTSHSYACKPARNERHIINIECFLISPFEFPKISS